MKRLVVTCTLQLLVAGCMLRTHQDSFLSLRDRVKQTLAESCACGPVITNEVLGGRYFEVAPRPHGLAVHVYERQFVSRKEWERRHTSGTELLEQFLEATNNPMDAETAKRFIGITNFFGLEDLPEWSYQRVGIDVKVQEVDETYPGSEEDSAEGQKRYEEIMHLLKPYRRR